MDKESVANISDTQNATFDFGDLKVAWTHRSWGRAPDPKYPWALVLYGEKGTLKASVNSYDFIPSGDGKPMHGDAVFEDPEVSGRRPKKIWNGTWLRRFVDI